MEKRYNYILDVIEFQKDLDGFSSTEISNTHSFISEITETKFNDFFQKYVENFKKKTGTNWIFVPTNIETQLSAVDVNNTYHCLQIIAVQLI